MSRPSASRERALLVGLLCLTAGVFRGVVDLPFVGIDDPDYVTENVPVRRGLTLGSLRWAATALHAGNWHPVTWLSHMLDVSLFGVSPAGHHLVNLVLHAANVLLAFALFARLTGAVWRSGLLAALFAVHPLRVESVAWVAERKDLLAGTFWLGTMLAYWHYSRAPSGRRYGAVAALFGLGLASKPMLVTLPFALLLLDAWPLGRIDPARPSLLAAWRLVREKLPLLGMAAASCVLTLVAQARAGAVQPLASLALSDRVANAPLAVVRYLAKTVWPSGLAVFYPYPPRPGIPTVALAVAALGGVTVLAFKARARCPWATIGWLWFLGTLVPVLGLVQVGAQSMADRYTYLPSMGLALVAAWSMPAPQELRRAHFVVGGLALAMVLGALSIATVRQIRHWSTEQSLFAHALAVTERNWLAETIVGVNLEREGDDRGALAHYWRALDFRPLYPEALNNLGALLFRTGRTAEGLGYLGEAVRQAPGNASALRNLGASLCALGRNAEGLPLLVRAAALAPGDATARFDLGLALLQVGRSREAFAEFQAALWLDPADRDARLQVERLRAVGPP